MDVLDVIDRLRDEIADMVVVQRIDDPVAVAPTGHETEMTQEPQLMRDRRLLQLHIPRQLGHRTRRLSQPRENPNPARRGESLHRLRDLFREIGVDRREWQFLAVLKMTHGAQLYMKRYS